MKFFDFRRAPEFCGKEFLGPSWAPSDILARAFDGDCALLSVEQQETLLRWTGRTVLPARAPDVFALVVGRRAGKSRNAALMATYLLAQDYTDRLAPGETADVAVVAPDREQAGVAFDYIRAIVHGSDILRVEIVNETADSITFRHRTRLLICTASFRTIRGRTLAGIVLDEAAFLPSEGSALPDEKLFEAIKPGLMTLNGRVVIISSPHIRQGLLFDLYGRYFGNDRDDTGLVIQASSLELNPTLDAAKIEAEAEADPESAASEYFGKFRTSSSSYLDEDLLSAAVVRERRMLPYRPGVSYQAWADASSGRNDAFAVSIAHTEPGGRVVQDAFMVKRPPFHPSEAVESAARLIAQYGLRHCTGDRYAVGYVSAEFARCGIGYVESVRNASEIYRQALPLFTARRIELLDEPQLLHELRLLSRRPQPGGGEKIEHPQRSYAHDDLAAASVGSLLLAAEGPVPGEYGSFGNNISRAICDYNPLDRGDPSGSSTSSVDARRGLVPASPPILYH